MKLNRRFPLAILLGFSLLSLASCEDDEAATPVTEVTEAHQYVIAASSGENSYLLQTNSIESGSVSAQGGNAIQVLGDRSWFFYEDLAAYSFIYAQNLPGVTSSFVLDEEGMLTQRQELGLEVSMQSRGTYKDNLIVEYSSRSYADPVATFYKINAVTEEISPEISVSTENFTGNGEMAYFTDIAEYGDYILLGVRTISGGADAALGTFGTKYADSTFVAVYDENFNLQKIIRDGGRTGQVAGQSRSQGETGIEQVENGDLYVFSSAMNSTSAPSGVLKINSGELEFDDDYFFNISEASGGNKLYRVYYIGGTTFCLQMYETAGLDITGSTTNSFAIVDVAAKTFNWVTNVPSGITEVSTPYVDQDNNEIVFGITTTDTYPHLYIIDPATATMTQGIEVIAEGISGIGKLSY
ncbi:DUF4374 domain-containing protein [Pontibacter silvestris]|uniref:DUF4374 domain-containing protein n=1 Tax=Pontibacter silvestris TaxID=2305183 RepID=A0ABW4WVB0_9BACT|nr:DUF4374 domain-containing protein [Pontibacter silvestris]MCC9138412.1 DUF4374 domain-containing protein [Pontibacter silvestris]